MGGSHQRTQLAASDTCPPARARTESYNVLLVLLSFLRIKLKYFYKIDMSIDPKCVELTADVLKNIFIKQTKRCLDQKEQKKKLRREPTLARPTPTPAGSGESSKVRHVQETARRELDLSSSYFEGGSKRGLNRSLRLLSCKHQHVYICIYYILHSTVCSASANHEKMKASTM